MLKADAKSKFILFYAYDTLKMQNLKWTKNRLVVTMEWEGESNWLKRGHTEEHLECRICSHDTRAKILANQIYQHIQGRIPND